MQTVGKLLLGKAVFQTQVAQVTAKGLIHVYRDLFVS